ncbi:alpha/beta hydrolase [Bosea sp. 685]|uniref:alpha/beta hydrolase n=1 Tax=Bosea sp. 685 TaxID=3080057 RepID=UPI0028930337|nr:alpha/beta hydrolase [Bosea sp. 685]WNJ89255.1 alpha/beta hydrolase [Bosea sp. 685]
MERDAPQWLDVGEGTEQRRLAYLAQPGDGAPVLWLGGFRSDMRATKAEALAEWARLTGHAFLRFDYAGHGETGGDFARWTLSHWLEDALAMIAARCGAPPILVGSSMGGWIALLAARKLLGTALAPAGLVLIAPAVDFSEDLMWAQMPDAIRETILRDGVWLRPSEYSPDPTPITRALIEDGRRHLMFGSEIRTGCPVHILQGMADPDVPWRQAVKLVEHLAGDPVLLTLIKDGDHRLSTPGDIARLTSAVAGVTAPA